MVGVFLTNGRNSFAVSARSQEYVRDGYSINDVRGMLTQESEIYGMVN